MTTSIDCLLIDHMSIGYCLSYQSLLIKKVFTLMYNNSKYYGHLGVTNWRKKINENILYRTKANK